MLILLILLRCIVPCSRRLCAGNFDRLTSGAGTHGVHLHRPADPWPSLQAEPAAVRRLVVGDDGHGEENGGNNEEHPQQRAKRRGRLDAVDGSTHIADCAREGGVGLGRRECVKQVIDGPHLRVESRGFGREDRPGTEPENVGQDLNDAVTCHVRPFAAGRGAREGQDTDMCASQW